jgi:predicted transcriptional regulator of viral defense system
MFKLFELVRIRRPRHNMRAMPYRSTIDARRELIQLAQTQGGYFTTRQAAGVGYDRPHLDYHVKAGNFERIHRGIYRLADAPVTEHDELIRLSLWSRGRDDQPQAVVSHETALGVHALGDLLAGNVHLTVPRTFRKPAPKGCVLHKATIAPDEIEQREGFAVTTPIRTIIDVAVGQAVTQDQLNDIVRQALSTGQVRRKLALAAANDQELRRLSIALDTAG